MAPGTLVDGELVIADARRRSDFGALQERLSVGKRDARSGASHEPAVLLAFDLLWDAGADVTEMRLSDRRVRLERLLEPE